MMLRTLLFTFILAFAVYLRVLLAINQLIVASHFFFLRNESVLF